MLIEVTAGFIVQNNRILIARRPLKGDHGGGWEFPGGKVKRNESLPQALARELQEELSMQISHSAFKSLGFVETEKIRLHFFALPMTNFYLPIEHIAVAWSSWSELPLFDLCPADRLSLSTLEKPMKDILKNCQ